MFVNKIFGRKSSRSISSLSLKCLDFCIENYSINFLEINKRFNINNINKIFLEIGCGYGENLIARAIDSFDTLFLASEPFLGGLSSIASQIIDNNLKNIRISRMSGQEIMSNLNDDSIDKVFLLFPDPWPKNRHKNRRFIQKETIKEIHRVLKKNGLFIVATDHDVYKKWIDYCFEGCEFFKSVQNSEFRPIDWVETRYEMKAISSGRMPNYYTYRKI